MYIIITNYSFRAFSEKEKIYLQHGESILDSATAKILKSTRYHMANVQQILGIFFNYLATYMSILEKSLNMIYSLDFLYENKFKLK